MKQFIFTLLALYFCPAASAQLKGEVIYERILTFNEAAKPTFLLYFNPGQSVFSEQNAPPAEQRVQHSGAEEGGTLEFKVRLGSGEPYAVFTDFSKKQLVSRITGSGNKTVLVNEGLPEMVWQVEEDQKTIGRFSCRKARGHFRGRAYTAWFTSDIPIKMGPWKFNGLPGLILEIYDDKGEVYFGARSVRVPSDFPEKVLEVQNKGYRTLSLNEYIREREDQVNEVLTAIQSKLPRGSAVSFSQQSVNAIETEFEKD